MVHDYGLLQGGAEITLCQLRQGLQAAGDEVRIFTSTAGAERDPTTNAGRTWFADAHCRGTTSSFRTLLQSANPWASHALRRELDRFKPDVVHLSMFLTQLSPLVLPELAGVPCVYQAHWQRLICPKGTRVLPDGGTCHNHVGGACYSSGCLPLRDWIPLMLQHRMLQRWRGAIDRIIADSECLRLRLTEAGYPGVDVIPPGMPEQPARPPLEGPPSVIYAGRLVREKGVNVLLDAFRLVLQRVPSAVLHIAGAGREEHSLREQAASPGLAGHVRFHGWLADTQREQLSQWAWVQVVPSLWEEPFGLTALEAAARGTATVASAIGGLSEIVRNGQTGFLVPPGSSEKLADALVHLLESRDLAESMGRSAQARARDCFSESAYVDRFRGVYQDLVAARSAG